MFSDLILNVSYECVCALVGETGKDQKKKTLNPATIRALRSGGSFTGQAVI